MTAAELIKKTRRAAQSDQLLLDADDVDGTCNRAYYAMFDAARAALMVANADSHSEATRTHGGLITVFSLSLVKTGRVPVDLGRSLNKVHELRLVADYKGDRINPQQAQWTIEQAVTFVKTIRANFIVDS